MTINDDSAQQAAQDIWNTFSQTVQQQPSGDYFDPPPGYQDPDPSTTVDPHPAVQAVQDAVTALDSGSFGGIYQTTDGVLHVGLTGGAAASVTQTVESAVAAAAPGTTVSTFPASYSWSDLVTIGDQLVDQMANDSTGTIVSVTPDAPSNTVIVGVTDVNSPIATAIQTQYGSAVTIVGDEPIEELASKPYPDRAEYHQPGYGGLYITAPDGTACTSGFGYHFGSPTGLYYETGFAATRRSQ